eukprot:705233-Heterocapsa_arctica.AAC.1
MRQKLPAWYEGPREAGNQGGPGQEVNARRESDRFLADMARRWIKTNAHIWDGINTPCWCGDFDILHHHQVEGNGEEPTIVP